MLYKLNVQVYRKESLIIKRKYEASARKTTIVLARCQTSILG